MSALSRLSQSRLNKWAYRQIKNNRKYGFQTYQTHQTSEECNTRTRECSLTSELTTQWSRDLQSLPRSSAQPIATYHVAWLNCQSTHPFTDLDLLFYTWSLDLELCGSELGSSELDGQQLALQLGSFISKYNICSRYQPPGSCLWTRWSLTLYSHSIKWDSLSCNVWSESD